PEGLKRIARRVHGATSQLAAALKGAGFSLVHETWFDTLTVAVEETQRGEILDRCANARINLRTDRPGVLGLSLDEALVESGDWTLLFEVFGLERPASDDAPSGLPKALRRQGGFLAQPVF